MELADGLGRGARKATANFGEAGVGKMAFRWQRAAVEVLSTPLLRPLLESGDECALAPVGRRRGASGVEQGDQVWAGHGRCCRCSGWGGRRERLSLAAGRWRWLAGWGLMPWL